ncbi:MAG: hypothetical protein HG459_002310 [Bacteroidia bacterium]|nr:hypothetical protein [Bacteroidia bacterium]
MLHEKENLMGKAHGVGEKMWVGFEECISSSRGVASVRMCYIYICGEDVGCEGWAVARC